MKKTRGWILAASSVLLTLYALSMAWYTRAAAFARHGETLYSQIVELQTPRRISEVQDLLRAHELYTHEDQIAQYRASVTWDNTLLVLYTLQLIAVSAFAWCSRSKSFAVAAIVLITAGAVCDAQENRHILQMLDLSRPTRPLITALRYWSIAKWLLDGGAWLSAAIALHRCSHGPSGFAPGATATMNRWRLRFVTATLYFSGLLPILGAASFFYFRDFRALLQAGVLLNAMAVVGCIFRPR